LWLDGGDNNTFPGDVTTFATAPWLTFDANAFVGGGTLTNPVNSADNQVAYFGPNLQASTTPEPGTIVMMGSGLLALGGFARRKLML
jgi:hypothetical protein